MVDSPRPHPHRPRAGGAGEDTLRAHGPTPYAFTLRSISVPDSDDTDMLLSPEDWTCPASAPSSAWQVGGTTRWGAMCFKMRA